MKPLPSRLVSLGAAALLGLLGASGALAGMALGEHQSRPDTQTLAIAAPADAAGTLEALRSSAGFSGLEDGALGGDIVRVGTTTAPRGDTFSVISSGAELQVTSESNARLYRIAETSTALAPGDVVVVRLEPDGSTGAVLRVPADLREGDAR